MPEKAPMGQLPRSIELVLDDDLVDRVKPGDRVQVVGVYRALSTSYIICCQWTKYCTTSGLFQTVVLVNHVQILGRDVSQLTFVPEDVKSIRSLSKRHAILDVLGRSLAPSIHGHHVIKKALALQLLSGCGKEFGQWDASEGRCEHTHGRGSIHG
jgi:DNA replication licensing factor MCM3